MQLYTNIRYRTKLAKKFGEKIFFIYILKVTYKKNRFRNLIRIRLRIRSHVYGTTDPDPYQNVTDSERCLNFRPTL
jgi:hypothetical protein